MMLVAGWPSLTHYALPMRQGLANLGAVLREEQLITGCMAALPSKAEGRQWLFSFFDALRSVGIHRIGVMLPVSELSQSTLWECRSAGIREVVLIQDVDVPEAAIEIVSQDQETALDGRMELRVWLDHLPGGNYIHSVCAWRRKVPTVLTLEPSPFIRHEPPGATAAPTKQNSAPLECDWLNSILTVLDSGVVVPCPAHAPRNAPVLGRDDSANILKCVMEWRDALNSSPVCRSCHRLGRFMIPDCVFAPDQPEQTIRLQPSTVPYIDHVQCDAGIFSEGKFEKSLADFLIRVRRSNL